MRSSLSAGRDSPAQPIGRRPTGLAVGLLVVALIILLAVVGGAAEHGAGTAQLRRGPASILLSVLTTLSGFAGVASLMLLFWALVTRNRRSLDGSAPKRHSPVLVTGVLLAIFACFTALLALAARKRYVQPLLGLTGRPGIHSAPAGHPLPFNTAASFATSSFVIAIVAIVALVRIVRSMGWRRVLRGLHSLSPSAEIDSEQATAPPADLGTLGRELAALSVADPSAEPDPRRAVIGCYLQMLEVAARHGPARRVTETPTEYLRRMLALTGTSEGPATTLTALFELARYSAHVVEESMRSEAIGALSALRNDLLAGATG